MEVFELQPITGPTSNDHPLSTPRSGQTSDGASFESLLDKATARVASENSWKCLLDFNLLFSFDPKDLHGEWVKGEDEPSDSKMTTLRDTKKKSMASTSSLKGISERTLKSDDPHQMAQSQSHPLPTTAAPMNPLIPFVGNIQISCASIAMENPTSPNLDLLVQELVKKIQGLMGK